IYCRKSSEEGLEQSFNSLHAQREACEAFVTSQRQEGWRVVPTHYDDGGYSGGSMDRPALQQLLRDVKDRKINIIVVYKVDRLTRNLTDFAKIIEILDAHRVSFVSVTQQFNTTVHGPAHAERVAVVRPVRERGYGRAHPRQDCGLQKEGHVDGR